MNGVIFSKLIPVNSDERGEIWDILNETVAHVGMLPTKKGALRGNHYFKTSKRYAFVMSGKFEVFLASASSSEKVEKHIMEKGDIVEIPPGIIHTFIALEDSVLIGMDTVSRAKDGYEKEMVRVKII